MTKAIVRACVVATFCVVATTTLSAGGNGWVYFWQTNPVGDTCNPGAMPWDDIVWSVDYHAYFRNTCWDQSIATFAEAHPTITATGECGSIVSGQCSPYFQGFYENGSEWLHFDGTGTDKWLTAEVYCRDGATHHSAVDVQNHYPTDYPCPPQPPPSPEEECRAMGFDWICGDGCYCNYLNCPLIIDVAGDGLELTSSQSGVSFDLQPDGIPETLSWTAAGSDDSFLVLDSNGNGLIDNGRELFSNFAPRTLGSPANGFSALAVLDSPSNGGNGDGVLSSADRMFTSLQLWNDSNHDGVSQVSELRPVAGVISAIDLSYRASERRDRFGNVIRYRSKLTSAGTTANRWAYDVFLIR